MIFSPVDEPPPRKKNHCTCGLFLLFVKIIGSRICESREYSPFAAKSFCHDVAAARIQARRTAASFPAAPGA
jgi:hypothetical protein